MYELDPTMDLAVKPSSEEEGRRRFFTRRSGGIAVRSTESLAGPIDAETSFAQEFGVESAIHEYDQAWDVYTTEVTAFFDEEETVDLYDQMTGFVSLQEGTRSEKRKGTPQREKALQDIATATLLVARAQVSMKSDIRRGAAGFADVPEITRTGRRLRGKMFGILEGFRPSITRDKFHERIADLEESIAGTYGNIVKIEDKIIQKLYETIGDPAKAVQLIEGFIETGASEARNDKKFVQFLSTLYALNPKNSVLAQALESVREGIETGSVSRDFVRSKLAEQDGDNQYAFMSVLLDRAGVKETFEDHLAKNFVDWPTDMLQEYRDYANQYISGLSTAVHRIAGQNTVKLWVRPTVAMTETFLDDVFYRLHGKYAAGSVKKLSAQERQNTLRAGLNLQVSGTDSVPRLDTISSKEVLAPKKLAVIANGLNGVAVWQNEGITTDEIIRLFIKDGRISKEHRQELTMILDKLRREPLGEGTQLLRLGKRKPDATKFYRINPVHAGMPIVEAKKSRIIFALDGDVLGIYSVTTDYDRYRTTIDSLQGSKL